LAQGILSLRLAVNVYSFFLHVMLAIAFTAVCLACAGQGRRVQVTRDVFSTTSHEDQRSSPKAQQAQPNVGVRLRNLSKQLATSSLAFRSPPAGFVSVLGSRLATNNNNNNVRAPSSAFTRQAASLGNELSSGALLDNALNAGKAFISNVTLREQDLRRALARGTLALCAATAILAGGPNVACAENELEAVAHSKGFSEIVQPSCFAQSCKSEMEACAGEADCLKGLTCSAKCMGDTQCTLGCFARYGNKALDKVLQCTIEDNNCIQIATQERGADSPFTAPLPPKALVKATPAVMSGKWYKVLGFNPNYDCMECQKNTFTSGPNAKRLVDVGTMEITPNSAVVEVEYTMPRERIGEAPSTFEAKLVEKLEFDAPGSRRTAHTEGRMFGLTFYENWYLIGKNQGREPEFRFVFYNGKTLQNRYEGAFVYARTPELPQAAMPSIYQIAREAGFEPTKACCIDNSCFGARMGEVAQPPLFTPVAFAAEPVPEAPVRSLQDQFVDSFLQKNKLFKDVAEMLEDPRPAGKALQARQRPMTELREYDANGYRKPSASYAFPK